ncbi:HD-GYP domain-containing protein [Brevibacillus humidisoli]|uniref:HD-GYP domain-containing protein n=1 Tax=Brevibacillus humidisoli TaxID=2895522 RepID=UPI001E4D3C8E|nr:HD-GYP domain-containing protein [Brevibacillus humidisoli]UFJ39877.1 HD-GYP domain-containing protein [Brevibacillus humidisoli]
MKEVSVWSLCSGDVLAKPIYSPTGNILLGEGKIITEQQIKRLKKLNIKTAYIKELEPEKVVQPNTPGSLKHGPERTYADAERIYTDTEQTIDHKLVSDTVTGFLDSHHVKGLIAFSHIEDTFRQSYRKIFREIVSSPFILDQLVALYKKDLFVFHHSLKVAVTSGIVGLAQKYDYQQLLELTIGALLYDIGMTKLSEHLVKSTGPLTQWERTELEVHTIYGYQILTSHREVPKAAALCALQHHERFDGTGYPYQLKESQIHPYAQIVAICDVYNALTSPRHYRSAYTHHEAIEYLYAAGNKYFDVTLIKTFLKHICVYPVECKVLLSNGKIGVVASMDLDTLHRPVVKVIREPDGTPIDSPYEIDLKKNVDVVIVNAL